MSELLGIRYPEPAYFREVLYALEVIDAVTLERVTSGLEVVAEGLERKPTVNQSGVFVWLVRPTGSLRRIAVKPGRLPYDGLVIPADEIEPRKLKTVELAPRVDYPFAAGVTGFRGRLVESRLPPPETSVPVTDAEVRLRWLDEDGSTWRNAPTKSRTNRNGDFAAIVRLASVEVPQLDGDGALTVRLRASRFASNERESIDVTLPAGRVADPSTHPSGAAALTFAWDELQP